MHCCCCRRRAAAVVVVAATAAAPAALQKRAAVDPASDAAVHGVPAVSIIGKAEFKDFFLKRQSKEEVRHTHTARNRQ